MAEVQGPEVQGQSLDNDREVQGLEVQGQSLDN